MKTIVGLFGNHEDANNAVTELEDLGYGPDDLNIVARDKAVKREIETTDSNADGATTGATVGGLLGLLAGVGLITIPGIGPILAAGPLVAALGSAAVGAGVGAAAGGIVGALIDAGIPENEAQIYAEGVKKGHILLAVNTADDSEITEVEEVLDNNNAIDTKSLRTN